MIINTGFFDPVNGGDPTWLQHIYWFFGHPGTWLMLLKWLVIIIATVIIARRLFRARRIFLMVLVLAALVALMVWNFHLMREAHGLFVEGRGHEVVTLRVVNWGTVFLSYAAAAWIIFIRTSKNRNP